MDGKGQMIGQGNTAEVFNWGTESILKLYRSGLPDTLCTDEFHKTSEAYNLVKTVPKPIKIIRDKERIGAVYQKIKGKTMLKEMLAKPWSSRKYAKQFAEYHIDMQRPVDFEFPTVKDKLKCDISYVDVLKETEKQQLYKYLKELPDGNILCHFDLHPDNIMLSGDNYYIIDWMTACKGDKFSDVARTYIMLTYSQIPEVPVIVNYILGIFQKELLKIYLKTYLQKTNSSLNDLEKWKLPIAAARLSEWIPEKEKQQLLAFVRKNLE